jgi:hypothetical protein
MLQKHVCNFYLFFITVNVSSLLFLLYSVRIIFKKKTLDIANSEALLMACFLHQQSTINHVVPIRESFNYFTCGYFFPSIILRSNKMSNDPLKAFSSNIFTRLSRSVNIKTLLQSMRFTI